MLPLFLQLLALLVMNLSLTEKTMCGKGYLFVIIHLVLLHSLFLVLPLFFYYCCCICYYCYFCHYCCFCSHFYFRYYLLHFIVISLSFAVGARHIIIMIITQISGSEASFIPSLSVCLCTCCIKIMQREQILSENTSEH